jgi:hypothetical protein
MDRARRDVEVRELPRALAPGGAGATADDLRSACAELRDRAELARERAVLLANPLDSAQKTVREIAPLALAAATGLDVWCGPTAPWLAGEPRFRARFTPLIALFRHKSEFDAAMLRELELAGRRTFVALVRDEDRALNPQVFGKLERLGFARWREHGGVTLWIGPHGALERLEPAH